MKKFVSKEKLSKKARKALNDEKRVKWATPPITRVVPNKKKDAQKKSPPADDAGWDFFAEKTNFFCKIAKIISIIAETSIDRKLKNAL